VIVNALTYVLLPGRFAMVATARTCTVLGGGHVLDLVVAGIFGAHEAMIKTGQHLADVAARYEIGQGIAPAAQAIIGGTNTQRIERLAQRLNKISGVGAVVTGQQYGEIGTVQAGKLWLGARGVARHL